MQQPTSAQEDGNDQVARQLPTEQAMEQLQTLVRLAPLAILALWLVFWLLTRGVIKAGLSVKKRRFASRKRTRRY